MSQFGSNRSGSASTIIALIASLFTSHYASTLLAQEAINFNRDIRPILSENCFYCHGQDAKKRKADLRLDQREQAIEAGAITPGDVASELLIRIASDDADTLMPPPDSNRTLTPAQKAMLHRWIREGAPYASHWAYNPPMRPPAPMVHNATWVRNAIDRFVLAKLESSGLKPSAEADRTTLIKRLYVDLIGLPPSAAEVDRFVADADPNAYEKLVDRLLASPHYGERLALPWLDAARYADSNGFQQDGDTWQWIWRDWVVRAVNQDMPFDDFTIWQLAGDLLPNATIDQRIASGFNRNHLLNGEGGAIAEEQRFVILFDRIDTTATTWLGLTMACAQCHDHKYDPITQQDYYSLLDAFNRVPERGTPQRQSARIRVAAPFLELPTTENQRRIAKFESEIGAAQKQLKVAENAALEKWIKDILAGEKPAKSNELPKELKSLLGKEPSQRSEQEQKKLDEGLRKFFGEKVRPDVSGKMPIAGKLANLKKQLATYRGDQIPRVMIMSDAKPRQSSVLERGEYLNPTQKVSFNTPAFLPPLPNDAPRNRLGFARWLMFPEHPLTARVQVNRIWQYFFGSGFVKTAEDFGVQSEHPIHKALLDWLAVEFRECGWSMKRIHRLILTSATYRQSSRLTPQLLQQDQDNRLFARAARFRMPSMILRDWALAASDSLHRPVGGPPVYPYQPDAVWEALAITKERDFTYPTSKGSSLYRRSLYTFWRRTVIPANMFDASNRQACRVRVATTSTPLHALTTLNDPTWVEAARKMAAGLMRKNASLAQRLEDAFLRVVCRRPNQTEMSHLRRAHDKQLAIYQADSKAALAFLQVGNSPRDETLDAAQHAALTAVCLGVFNLDEALTRE